MNLDVRSLSDRETEDFHLRWPFAIVSFVTISLVCYLVLEFTWMGPARIGAQAQRKLTQLIEENQWDASIAPTHYFQDVKIIMNDIDEKQFKKMYPILQEIYWLRRINILAPEISTNLQAEIQREFPKCTLYNLGKQIE